MALSILFDEVSKKYRIGRGLSNLREALGGRQNTESRDIQWAVKDVSFKLEPGEALGIIGPNGAGKTTILKLLSKVTHPTGGQIRVNGRLSTLIELGAGFHPDLSGRENVFLNGAILGMRKAEIRARFDRIVEFSGIGRYLDTPVKRYSSGMHARLGFAIAAHVDPDVLLIDEVLAVGDYAFQQKCHARMDELRDNGTALILVSHNMEAIRRVCSKGLVMYRGGNIFHGPAAEAVVAYSDAVRRAARETRPAIPAEGGLSERVMTFDAEINNVELLNQDRHPITKLQSGEPALVLVEVCFHKDVSQPIFSFFIRSLEGYTLYDTTTRWMKMHTPDFSAGERCLVEFAIIVPLLTGEYELGVDVCASDLSHYYDRLERAKGFLVVGQQGAQGLVDLQAKISIKSLGTAGEPS